MTLPIRFRRAARRVLEVIPPARRLLAERDALRLKMKHLAPTKADASAVAAARAHLVNAPRAGLPDTGARWQEYSDKTRAIAAAIGSPLEAIRFAQDPTTHNGFEARARKDILAAMCDSQENFLRCTFPAFADTLSLWSESEYALDESTLEYGGRPVSSPMYLLTFFCMTCLDRLRPAVVCEIGGGYGAPARLWMTNPVHRPTQYIIVDLPESLFFAELYLGKHFGTENVCYAGDGDVRKAKIVLCPNGRIDDLAGLHIDLVVNTNSMAEMSEAYIDFFMAWLDRQHCRYFFSSNLNLQDSRDLLESQNTWSPRPSPLWKTLHLKHSADTNWPSTMAFYEKSPADVDERSSRADAALRALLTGWLDANALATALDHARLLMTKDAVAPLLEKITLEYPFTPKEAEYLRSRLPAMPARRE